MNIFKQSIRSQFALGHLKPNYALSLRQSPKLFSTGVEQPPPPQDFSFDAFLQNTGPGPVYAKLTGVAKHTLKSDIIALFEGCNLSPDDVKVMYDRYYMPTGMMMQFPSGQAYEAAFKALGRKGRTYKLQTANRSAWESYVPYDRKPAGLPPTDIVHDGKTVYLHGIPVNVLREDVDRFLCGCQYDSSSTHIFFKGPGEKAVLVRFHSRIEAMNAVITKNHGFCLNGRVSMRVLE